MLYYVKGNNPQVLEGDMTATQFVFDNITQDDFQLLANQTSTPLEHVQDIQEAKVYRNFAALDFDLGLANAVKAKIANANHYLYVLNKTKARLVVMIDHALSKSDYKTFIQMMNKKLGIVSTKSGKNINAPIKFKSIAKDSALSVNLKGDPIAYEVATHVKPDDMKLIDAAKAFIESDYGQDILHDRDKTREFVDSLLNASIAGTVSPAVIGEVIKLLTLDTDYTEKDWRGLFAERLSILRGSASARMTAKPFGSFIHLYSKNSKLTMPAQLMETLPKGAQPNPDYTLADAASFIEMSYPPYLLDRYGDDEDNMVVFDASSGMWTHDDNDLKAMLEAIKPYSTETQYKTFIMTFAAKARMAGRFIKPYSGSRYLLFNNCVLDVATLKTYDLADPFIRDLHFVQRSHINLDWEPRAVNPIIPEMRLADGGDWDPKSFFMGYAENDEERYRYLMFGLSFGLFGGHNFGVHFDVQGQSRWGKTTLCDIYSNLFDNRVMMVPFPSLNNQFPFTSYPLSTSVIWINECNSGVEPLNDSYGTIMYDGLADSQVRFQVKGKGDIVLDNPPQVYIDGTQFIKAKELATGPAGRTLAYKLPRLTPDLRNQIYSKDIKACLANKQVLQWIVKECVNAYRSFVPTERMDNFKLNLANEKDTAIFPKIVFDWRREFVVGASSVDSWFMDEVAPFISTDPAKPTYLHPSVLYYMYKHAYIRDNPQDEKALKIDTPDHILERARAVLDSDESYVTTFDQKARKQVGTPDKMNFDWNQYKQAFSMPAELDGSAWRALDIFGHRLTGWLSVYRKRAVK